MKAGKASSTARLIAAGTIMRELEGDRTRAAPAGAAAWCEQLLSRSFRDRLLRRSVHTATGRAFCRGVERFVLPGIVSHWMRRKQEIDRLARAAAADGFNQLIILGAGLDTLALRMKQEQVYDTVISVDHPATLSYVRAALHGTSTGVASLAADLQSDDLHAIFKSCPSFDPARATCVVIEGVLMYLHQEAVTRLFSRLASLPVPQMQLVASWMVHRPGRPISFETQLALVPAWLKRKGEPMLSAGTPAQMQELAHATGWSDARIIDLSEPNPFGLNGACGLPDERLIVAERGVAGHA